MLWVMAATLVCGASVFTACSVNIARLNREMIKAKLAD